MGFEEVGGRQGPNEGGVVKGDAQGFLACLAGLS